MTDPTAIAHDIRSLLDRDGATGRQHIETLAQLIRATRPGIKPDEMPAVVGDVIDAGTDAGLWEAAKTVTVTVGAYQLPKHITLPTAPRPTSRTRVAVPLRPELAWAADLTLTASQRQLIVAVNTWLRDTDGGKTAIVAAAERAYQLVRDEKAFDSDPPRGGTTLWQPGRLTLDLLACERIPTPLTWEAVAGHDDGPIVCVENHATYRTLLKVLRATDDPAWVAVCWTAGRNTRPLASLPTLPMRISRLDYLGDLDVAGLEIAAAACVDAIAAGVPAGPAATLWAELADEPARPVTGTPRVPAAVDRAVQWLPEDLRERCRTILIGGRMVPQEALRQDVLASSAAIRRVSGG